MTDKMIAVPRELLEELRDCANDCFNYESTLSYSRSTRVNFYEGLMEQCDTILREAEQPECCGNDIPVRIMDKLFCDMRADEEKAAFFLSGRGYETGVISHALQNDVAMAYHRCVEYKKELEALQAECEKLQKDAERIKMMGGRE